MGFTLIPLIKKTYLHDGTEQVGEMFVKRGVLLVEQEVVAGRLDRLEADIVVGVRQAAHQHLLDHLHVLALCKQPPAKQITKLESFYFR